MRVIEKKVYRFDELADKAKETARDYFRDLDYTRIDGSIQSIKTFCAAFNVSLLDYSVGAYLPFEYKTDASVASFRGKRLSQFNRNHAPTGYCLDNTLWTTFYDVFKTTGDAECAFNKALDAGFKSWREALEYQNTAEYSDEFILMNEYEFYEDGKLF